MSTDNDTATRTGEEGAGGPDHSLRNFLLPLLVVSVVVIAVMAVIEQTAG
jgi:hypothetical protein